jgi:hypothetical protein
MNDPLAELAQVEGVPSAIAAAIDAVDVVLRDRGPRTITAEQRGRALLAAARANAALSEDPALWSAGSARLASELVELAATIRIAPAQALARAHAVIARGIISDDELGRVTGGPAVQQRVSAVVDLLAGPQRASALVLGAIVHAEIATAGPFGASSGLIARAAEHLVLISSGLDPAAVIVVEAGHAENTVRYRAGLAGYRQGSVLGVRDWILQCAAAVSRGAELSPVNPRAAGVRADD